MVLFILQVLTAYYERCGRYYSHGGWGSFGTASEQEKRLTMMLFSGIFDSLGQRVGSFTLSRCSILTNILAPP